MKRTADERYVAHLGFTGVYQGAGQWFGLPNGVFQENTGIGMVFEHGIERAGARRQRTIEVGHLDGVPAPRAVLAGSKQLYVFSVFEEKPSLRFVDDDLFHSMYNLPKVFACTPTTSRHSAGRCRKAHA